MGGVLMWETISASRKNVFLDVPVVNLCFVLVYEIPQLDAATRHLRLDAARRQLRERFRGPGTVTSHLGRRPEQLRNFTFIGARPSYERRPLSRGGDLPPVDERSGLHGPDAGGWVGVLSAGTTGARADLCDIR